MRARRLTIGWSRAIRLLAPVAALVVEGWPALIGALVIQEGGIWLSRRLADPCRRGVASQLFVAAYGLRVAIALPVHYVEKLRDGSGALFLDDYTNDLVGEWLVRIARGDGISIFVGHQHQLESAYSFVLMGIYAVLGYAPLVPKLLNIGLAALCVVLIFEIAQHLFGTPTATLAALGATALPSMVIWSIVTLKETPVLFLAILGLWTLQLMLTAARRDPRIGNLLVAMVGSVMLLVDLRITSAVMLVALAALALGLRLPVRSRAWPAALATLAVVVVVGGGALYTRARTSNRPVTSIGEDVVLQIRHRRAQEAANAASQIRPPVDVVAPTGSEIPLAEAASDAAPFSLTGDILEPLGYALFAPAPWQARSTAELAASVEMPFWYVLIAASLLAWRAGSRHRVGIVLLGLYAIGNWLSLAIAEGNVGNLLRHRLLLDPALLILGSAGLTWLWERCGRPFAALVPRRLALARSEPS